MSSAELPRADEIELSDIAFWLRPPPEREPFFAALRRDRPISFHEEFEPPPDIPMSKGPGYWALTRHADILEMSRTPELFCSGQGTQIPDQPPAFNEFFGSMINMDDPRHGRLRRIVARGFTPKSLSRVEQEVGRLATQIIDAVHEKGECDFVTEIAAPLPLAIICDMMGIPESQQQFVFEQTNVILGLSDPEYVPPGKNLIVAALEAGKGLADLMVDLAAIRQKEPKDDLTSQLIHAELEGDRLSHQELASFFVLLVVAGNETTRNAISHGMKALTDFPDERRKWAADFDGLAPTAVEEIVRWASPVLHFRRTVTRDTVLSGQELKEGDKVVVWYQSGNRDEQAFDHPERFDVSRDPNEHVGFGGPGPHFCLGAQLARREIRVMMREILTRLPDLEITGEPDWLMSNFIHGIKHMPCAWTPGR
jgi:cytochrome P450